MTSRLTPYSGARSVQTVRSRPTERGSFAETWTHPFLVALFFAALLAPQVAAWEYYFSATQGGGSYRESDSDHPILFTNEVVFKYVIRENPGALSPEDNEVVIYMLPGVYVTGPLSFLFGDSSDYTETVRTKLLSRRLKIWGGPELGVVFRFDPNKAPPDYASATLLSNYGHYPIERWEIENITFDCNWSNLATRIHPACLESFKMGALSLNGYTGRLRNLRVKNYGTNGVVPITWFNTSGTEAFPIAVHATDFRRGAYDTNNPTAWVVEDCEVSGFSRLHRGYATAIMATVGYPATVGQYTLDDAATLDDAIPSELRGNYENKAYWWEAAELAAEQSRRVITVRRCQIRGGSIGFGTVKSAGLVFSDNVVVSCDSGFNTDFGPIRNVDIANNVFLDVNWGGNIAAMEWGTGGFRNYNVRSNVIRLASRPLLQHYNNYKYNNGQYVSDTTIVLGRPYTNTSVGLCVGGSSAIDFSYTRLTTRPRAWFYEPDPSQSTNALFRAVWRPNNALDYPWFLGTSTIVNNDCPPATDNVQLSGAAFTFTNYSFLVGGGLTNEMPATDNFPSWASDGRIGFVRRASPSFDVQGRLTWVGEIGLGGPVIVGTNLQVKAQWLCEPTYLDASPATMVGWPNDLRFQVTGPSGEMLPTNVTYSADTATCVFAPNGSGLYKIVAFMDAWLMNNNSLDPDIDCWSEVEYVYGNTVRFVPAPDIANDRSLTNGTLTLERTGSEQLTVKLRYVITNDIGSLTSPQTSYSVERFGKLGEFTNDFTLKTAPGQTLSQNQDGSFDVVFGGGVSRVTLLVSPAYDQLAESEVVYFWVDDANQPYSAIASHPKVSTHPLMPKTASVAIYDGPAWAVKAFIDFDPYPSPQAAATYINGLNDRSSPHLAGYSYYSYYPNIWHRVGYWTISQDWLLNKIMPYYFSSTTPQVRGISYDGMLVGVDGSRAFYGVTNDMSAFPLPLLATNFAAQAYGVNPNNSDYPTWPSTNLIVGAGQNANGVWRPVRWNHNGMNWVTEDLGAFAVGDAEAPGYAYAINDQKKVVGISRRTYLEGAQQLTNLQAFRTAAETTISQSSAPLLKVFPEVVDQGITNYNHTNVARAINVVGDAAGASQILVKIGANYTNQCRAAFWRQDSQDPVDLGVLNGGDHSEILGLNCEPYKNGTNWQTFPEYRSLRVQFVGWSNTQSNGAARRAIYGYYYPWKYYWMALYNLNDPNFVQGVGSWTLQEARAINDQGHIVGIGTYQGRTTGFLLVPLSPAP